MNNSNRIPARLAGGSNGANCDKTRELLSAYLDGELPEKEAVTVRRHLAECLDCEEVALELDKVRQMVKGLPQLKAPAELAERVRQQLAGTRTTNHEQQTTSIFWSYRWAIRGLATAAAAFLVVYMGLFLMSHKDEQSQPAYHILPEKKISINEKAKTNSNIGKELANSEKPSHLLQQQRLRGDEDAGVPIAFSQEVRITSKDNDETLRSIKNIMAKSGGDLSDEREKYLTPDMDNKSGENNKKTNKIARKSVVRVVLPMDQREAFIEQLKIHKIGNVRTADLKTIRSDTITANKILEGQVVSQVNKQLNDKIASLKKSQDETGENGGFVSDNIARKKDSEMPMNMVGKPQNAMPPAAPRTRGNKAPIPASLVPSKEPLEQVNKEGELKKIDNNLIILHDLEQQKKVAEKSRSMEIKGKSNKDEPQDKILLEEKTEEDYADKQKANPLPLIEMIIIIEEE